MPRRSCSGAGKEEGKNAERRCRRKRHGPGLVDDGANRAHDIFSARRGRVAHAVGLWLLKPKRTSTGKEESCQTISALFWSAVKPQYGAAAPRYRAKLPEICASRTSRST